MNTTPCANFDFVRYANAWEDADILVEALKPSAGKRILSIGAAGDNSLALLRDGATIVAVDISPAQLACVELRREAMRELEREDFLKFIGVLGGHTIAAENERHGIYENVCSRLSAKTQEFWDARRYAFESGFMHDGKFEGYFAYFRWVLLLVHGRRRVLELLEPRNKEERERFYAERWDCWRWRLLFHAFFGRFVMGRLGRDPEFFRQVQGSVASRILERARYALTELDTSKNPYLRYILTGNYCATALPYYLREENYERIRANVDNLQIVQGSVDEVARADSEGFDGFNLSDIFEYLTPLQCREVYAALLDCAKPKARLAYWNMLVPRECPEEFRERIVSRDDNAQTLFARDRAFFYSRFIIEEVV